MKGPSIAVMLGGHSSGSSGGDDDVPEDSGDLSLSEAKASAEEAATAFASAVEAKDAKRIVKSFHALYELCEHVHELEESGEAEDEVEGKGDDEAAEE